MLAAAADSFFPSEDPTPPSLATSASGLADSLFAGFDTSCSSSTNIASKSYGQCWKSENVDENSFARMTVS